MTDYTRRKYIAATGATLTTALTGCLGFGGDSNTPTETDSPNETPPENTTQTPSDTATLTTNDAAVTFEPGKMQVNELQNGVIVLQHLYSGHEYLRIPNPSEAVDLDSGFYRVIQQSSPDTSPDNRHSTVLGAIQIGTVVHTVSTWEQENFTEFRNATIENNVIKQVTTDKPFSAAISLNPDYPTDNIGGVIPRTGQTPQRDLIVRFMQPDTTVEPTIIFPSTNTPEPPSSENISIDIPVQLPNEKLTFASFPNEFNPIEPFLVTLSGSTTNQSQLTALDFIGGTELTVLSQQ